MQLVYFVDPFDSTTIGQNAEASITTGVKYYSVIMIRIILTLNQKNVWWFGEKINYKNLEILETDPIKETETREKIRKE